MSRNRVESFDLLLRRASLRRIALKRIPQDQLNDRVQVAPYSGPDFDFQSRYFSTGAPFAFHSDIEPSYMLTS